MYENSDFSTVDREGDWMPNAIDSEVKKPQDQIATPDFYMETLTNIGLAPVDWSQIEDSRPLSGIENDQSD